MGVIIKKKNIDFIYLNYMLLCSLGEMLRCRNCALFFNTDFPESFFFPPIEYIYI